jgi:hypothetical protein
MLKSIFFALRISNFVDELHAKFTSNVGFIFHQLHHSDILECQVTVDAENRLFGKFEGTEFPSSIVECLSDYSLAVIAYSS